MILNKFNSLIGVIKIKSFSYSNVFYSWVTQRLIPVLPQKSGVFIDNVSFHKRQDILQAIEKAGHQVEFLPPYSPDLNPIEHKWAQAKRKKREIGCDIDTLFSVHIILYNQNKVVLLYFRQNQIPKHGNSFTPSRPNYVLNKDISNFENIFGRTDEY